jgi:asparagine synthase (glutamine-hydrolysing)
VSGIAGFIHFDGRPADAALLHRMTQAMAYRGPDGIQHRVRGSAALGYCALHAAASEQQPLFHEFSRASIVFDGRLDNGSELAALLLPVSVHGSAMGDAELALKAYARWGTDCAVHLDGDFAFAIWDEQQQMLFCARDTMGHKPLHYHWNGRTLVFASDVNAILQVPWVAASLNEGFLAELLSMDLVSLDETLWRGVYKLPAAHSLTMHDLGPTRREYWTPDLDATLPCRTEAEFAEHHRALVYDVVRQQSRSHLPVSFEVSGGLDSSALFAIGHRLHREGRLLAPNLRGYSLSFSEGYADESRYRRALESHLDTRLHEVAPATCAMSGYREFASTHKAILGFPNGVMMGSLYEAGRADGSRVMVGGIGGDEWLESTQDWRYTAVLEGEWGTIAKSLRQHRPGVPLAAAGYGVLRYGLLPQLPEALKKALRPFRGGSSRPGWLAPDLQRLHASRKEEALGSRPMDKSVSRVHAVQLAKWRDPWHAFVKDMNERHAAHFGIERRDPFWSRRVVQTAFALPDRLRGKGGTSKWLHRQSMRGILPSAILERDDKAEFSVVFEPYGDELRQAVADLSTRRQAWICAGHVSRLLRATRGAAERTIAGDLSAWSLLMVDAMVESGSVSRADTASARTAANARMD